MGFFRIFSLVTYLPIIDIPFSRNGMPIVRGASYKGLQFLSVLFIICMLVGCYWLKNWYQSHPVWGKVALCVISYWVLRQVVHFFRSLNDDPLTRTTPYKRD